MTEVEDGDKGRYRGERERHKSDSLCRIRYVVFVGRLRRPGASLLLVAMAVSPYTRSLLQKNIEYFYKKHSFIYFNQQILISNEIKHWILPTYTTHSFYI